MRTKTTLCTGILLLITFVILGQETNYTQFETFDLKSDLREGAVSNYFFDLGDNNYNDKMVNILLASEVGSYLNDSEELSLQNAYAILSTQNNRLFLGGTFDFFRKGDKTKKLSHLITAGVEADINNDFSSFFVNGEARDRIALNLKYTWIGRGIIFFNSEQKEQTKNYRELVIKNKYQKEVQDYLSDEFEGELKALETVYQKDSEAYRKGRSGILKKKATDIYEKMADDEIKYIRQQKLYNRLWDHFAVFEASIPVTETDFSIIPDITTTTIVTENFYPWEFTGLYTSVWKWSSGQSLFLTGRGRYFNNNSVNIQTIPEFELSILNPTNPSLISDTSTVYVGEFKTFETLELTAEAVLFLYKDMIGISGGLEQNFGELDVLDWKLGVPFSFKDKEGKSKVNFELQWREQNTLTATNHLVGISVGFPFGKYIQ